MTPAFATIRELQERGYSDFVWVGHKYNQSGTKSISAEFKIVTEEFGIPFYNLTAGKFMWWLTPQNFRYVIRDWFRIPKGFWSARKLIATEKPDIVVSFGGYLALPIVYLAKRHQIPVVTHEQTLVTGRANRWISKLADKVLVSWKSTLKDNPNYIHTGNPIRPEVSQVKSNNYTFPDAVDEAPPTLYITGGNQGSYNMSRRIFRILPELLEEFNIIHQTGDSTSRQTYSKALYLRDQLPYDLRMRYIPKPFIYGDEIGEVFSKSDIVFSRSGANIISEIALLGKLSVFMPIKWSSGGEQTKNAQMLTDTGLSILCKQTDAVDEPWRVKEYLLEAKHHWEQNTGFNGEPLIKCQQQAKKLIVVDATKLITDEIISLL